MAILMVTLAFGLSFVVTHLLIRFAPRLGLVQIPNERSSHFRPTPSGGGLAIAIAVLACSAGFALVMPSPWLWLVLGASAGALGFADDAFDLSAALRFVVQIGLICIAVWTSDLPDLDLFFGYSLTGLALGTVMVLAGVWWINLFNFMDGIDGLAASQAVLILAGAMSLWLWSSGSAQHDQMWILAAITVAATLGFIVLNWPPARIFMGDAGSNFLALTTLGVMLTMIERGVIGYAGALALTSVFVSDATVTLVRRIQRGERPWAAHRTHAYQRLALRYGHRLVTLAYAMLTLVWAIPLAVISVQLPGLEWVIALIALVPLSSAALVLGAGLPRTREDE